MPKWLVKLMDKKLIETETVVTAAKMAIKDGALVFSEERLLHSGAKYDDPVETYNGNLWLSATPMEEE